MMTQFASLARTLADSGTEAEAIVAALKTAGANPFESTKILALTLGYPLAEADELVLSHPAWATDREAILDSRNAFWGELVKTADRVEQDANGQQVLTWDLSEHE